MTQQRWLRIIPVALFMYTISYIDRTNVSLALDPNMSKMMKDLLMDDRLKGQAAGIFFFGYVLLQIPGGYLAAAAPVAGALLAFMYRSAQHDEQEGLNSGGKNPQHHGSGSVPRG